MKKQTGKKIVMTAAVFAAAFNMNACAYGPPEEDLYDETDSNYTGEVSETSEEPAAEFVFKPEMNYNADVYGPPEFFEEQAAADGILPETDDTAADSEITLENTDMNGENSNE